MRVTDIQTEQHDGHAVVGARVHSKAATRPLDLRYRIGGIDVAPDAAAEAMAVGLLAPAMYEGRDLAIHGAVCWTLARNLEAAQDVLSTWYPRLALIDVKASQFTRRVRGVRKAPGIACCFSGGVNSWYSLLKHDARVSHLLLVRGFDPALEDDDAWGYARTRIANVAEQLGKRLITCETNLRSVAETCAYKWGAAHGGDFWSQCLQSSMLASVALLLQHELGELIVPAAHTYQRLRPWGSSPLIDPMWSTDRLSVVHDGCESGRGDKIRFIASSDLALETLHVCRDPLENCGHCEACVRMQLALRAVGAADRATSFPRRFEFETSRVSRVLPIARRSDACIALPHAMAAERYAQRAELSQEAPLTQRRTNSYRASHRTRSH